MKKELVLEWKPIRPNSEKTQAKEKLTTSLTFTILPYSPKSGNKNMDKKHTYTDDKITNKTKNKTKKQKNKKQEKKEKENIFFYHQDLSLFFFYFHFYLFFYYFILFSIWSLSQVSFSQKPKSGIYMTYPSGCLSQEISSQTFCEGEREKLFIWGLVVAHPVLVILFFYFFFEIKVFCEYLFLPLCFPVPPFPFPSFIFFFLFLFVLFFFLLFSFSFSVSYIWESGHKNEKKKKQMGFFEVHFFIVY